MINRRISNYHRRGQAAVEYMLLLATVVTIVLIAFRTKGVVVTGSNLYFNRVAEGILGNGNPCGDGKCSSFESPEKCPADC